MDYNSLKRANKAIQKAGCFIRINTNIANKRISLISATKLKF